MIASIVTAIVLYVLQTTGVALVAWSAAVVLRLGPASLRYAYWRSVLALCVVLPGLSAIVHAWTPPDGGLAGPLVLQVAADAITPHAGGALAMVCEGIMAVLAIGILVRGLWLSIGLARLGRLRDAGTRADADFDAAIQRVLGTTADVRFVNGLRQPVTFGIHAPVVLLPGELRHADPERQVAILSHELIHVQRRDWRWVLAEAVLGAVLWFHPIVWWLTSEIELAREEVVDAASVRLTGSRRAYAEALMAFGDSLGTSLAAAFGRGRHLVRRITLVAKEERMSQTRILASAAVAAVILSSGAWQAARAFPLGSAAPAQATQAQRLGPGVVPPKIVKKVNPAYPPDAKKAKTQGAVVIEIRVDTDGAVHDPRVVKSIPELDAAAVSAVKQWTFTPAMKNGKPVPVLLDITISFTLK